MVYGTKKNLLAMMHSVSCSLHNKYWPIVRTHCSKIVSHGTERLTVLVLRSLYFQYATVSYEIS